MQEAPHAPLGKRLRHAADVDVHSAGAEQAMLQSPDVSTYDAATAVCSRAAALACTCCLVRPCRPTAWPLHLLQRSW